MFVQQLPKSSLTGTLTDQADINTRNYAPGDGFSSGASHFT